MVWLLKLIGFFFGYALGGTVGAVVGLVTMQVLAPTLVKVYQILNQTKAVQTAGPQRDFLVATFSIMGHLAKVDGRVSEGEIQVARIIMARLGLNKSLKLRAMQLFNQGKQADFDIDRVLSQVIQRLQDDHALRQLFFDIQLQAAYADGKELSANKKRILLHLCQRLGIRPPFIFTQQQRRATPTDKVVSLAAAYRLLDIQDSVTHLEVKKAYRRLMSKNHPDKLIAKGLSEEMLKIATEKTQKIKAAYEQICLARGI